MKIIKLIYFWFILTFSSLKNLFLSFYCYRTFKIYISNHLTIGIWQLHKKKTIFPHPVGIVIGMKVKMGINCTIYQNVTIGTKDTINYRSSPYPKIGNNVMIYPNSLIIGDIEIGDNAIIGAGAVVIKDIPANCVAVGNPAKII